MARLDQREAAGIETERFQPMAIEPAGCREALHRGDDEDGA